jgi:beta-glucosidase
MNELASILDTKSVSDPVKLVARRVSDLLAQMSLEEKIGQMSQVNLGADHVSDHLRHAIAAGRIGSFLNAVGVDIVNELQRIAVEESRLGIPLLIGRDVIHGFKTVFPIPLGQAASWHPERVAEAAAVAAAEAAASGIHWTFAPMIDISRDPRWGRIAESLGEDPYLSSRLAVAMVKGFQGDDLSAPNRIAACGKHFAGYGASESGRDYNTTNIPENEMRNVYLPPFKAAVEAGVATLMASFSDLDGVPASANEWLMKQVLREEWGFEGFVVSDWDSISQLAVHGLTANHRESALAAATAGIDMEMASTTYHDHLEQLVEEGHIDEAEVDRMVSSILRLKFELGLFDYPYTNPADHASISVTDHLKVARKAAVESLVLLKNEQGTLPLDCSTIGSLAVIGPLADAAFDQMGTWVFDGDPELSVTPLTSLREAAGADVEIRFAQGLATSRSRSHDGFAEALKLANASDAVLLFLGEESILSGEAHSRADICLPGAQEALIEAVAELGKPTVLIVMAGRPLAMQNIVDQVPAILYAWHPGSMGGPAITDVLLGKTSPSGKLPVTFPRVVGQIPIYYAHKQTGKPATPESFVHLDDIPANAPQMSVGNSSFHLDAGYTPLFAFGHGLSYGEFAYDHICMSEHRIRLGSSFEIQATLTNTGSHAAVEVAQLYIRDLVGNVTRPVRELKGFQRIPLQPGERATVTFEMSTDDLAFYGRQMKRIVEPGQFHAWIGGSSEARLMTEFEVVSE